MPAAAAAPLAPIIARLAHAAARAHWCDVRDLMQAAWLDIFEHGATPQACHPRAIRQAILAEVRNDRRQRGLTRYGVPRARTLPFWHRAPAASGWCCVWLSEACTHVQTCRVQPHALAVLWAWLVGDGSLRLRQETQTRYLRRAQQHLRRWATGQACVAAQEGGTSR